MYTTKLENLSLKEIDELILRAENLTAKGLCCPRKCGINRAENNPPCGALNDGIKVASISRHMGEEPPVSGTSGACNVFFSGCTMKCVFCQNFPFSQMNHGKIHSEDDLCARILKYQDRGVHNINLVTSDQYLLYVLKCIRKLKGSLEIPISYNCSGYHTPELLSIVDRFCDIYLYDIKYFSNDMALKYSGIRDYHTAAVSGAEFILKQNNGWIEEDGILKSGVIFRHLVLPGNTEDSVSIVNYISDLRADFPFFRFSLMSQYFPAYKVSECGDYTELGRRLTIEEYEPVMDLAEDSGIEGWYQEPEAQGGC